jgi:hypothetical protein
MDTNERALITTAGPMHNVSSVRGAVEGAFLRPGDDPMTNAEEMRELQLRGLADLRQFLESHGSALRQFGWYVDEAGNAFARVIGGKPDEASKIMDGYAEALGVDVREEPRGGSKRALSVRGRIGPSAAGPGRTIVLVTAAVNSSGGRA